MRTLPLRSFRLTCKPEQAPLVEQLLLAQGFVCEPDPFYAPARRLIAGPQPLGSSLAAFFGYIYIQDRSSMLPPLALAPERGAAVLDMCASPGSKTGLLAQLVGREGFVLANEPSQNRLSTLRRNLQTLNALSCATCSYPGEQFPLPAASDDLMDISPVHDMGHARDGQFSGWECILLDPPCSGWGTAEKHPQVLRLWQGDKVKPLIKLQRRLLTEAVRLLRPGGRLVYSTCTTNVEENEAQIRFACEELGLTLLSLEVLPGFCFADPQLSECTGVWRVDAGGDGQGFFIALLQKNSSNAAAADSSSAKCRQGGREKNGKSGKTPTELLERGLLAGPYLDIDLLPPGDIALFKAAAYFLPEHSRTLPKQDFNWKGFPLGRFGRQLRSNPYLRALMPSIDRMRQEGIPYLDLDDLAPVLTLLTGRHLPVTMPHPEVGLYFRGLPLCRLTVKGNRAMLPAL